MPWYYMLHPNKDKSVEISCYYSRESTADHKRMCFQAWMPDEPTILETLSDDEKMDEIHQFHNGTREKKQIKVFIASIEEVVNLLTNRCKKEHFFIGTSEFMNLFPHASDFTSIFHMCGSFGNKTSISLLIAYLEINGIVVEHTLDKNRVNNTALSSRFEHNPISEKTCIDLLVYSVRQNLLQKGDHRACPILYLLLGKTVTQMGKEKLNEMLQAPSDREWIERSLSFISDMRMISGLQPIREILKRITPLENLIFNEISMMELGTSGLADQSLSDSQVAGNAKSIYSRKRLEESTISKYRRIIKTAEKIKANVETIRILRKEISKAIPGMGSSRATGIFTELVEAISKGVLVDSIKRKLAPVNIISEEVTPLLADRFVNVVKPGIEPYLDLCRGVYETKLRICQDILDEIQSRCSDLEVWITEDKEICLTRRNSIKVDERDRQPMLEANKAGKTAVKRKNMKTGIHEENTKLFVLKRTKTAIFYSSLKLKAISKFINEIASQIIEIEGRICKSVLMDLQTNEDGLSLVSEHIADLDLLLGNLEVSKGLEYKKPYLGNTVAIYNASYLLFPGFQKTSYVFEKNEVYVITGANMAGKSCYLRNFAHISILVKLGCFIECDSIEIPIFDEIYHINTVEDINLLARRILQRPVGLEQEYNTPRRLVLIDELHCSTHIQLELLRLLQASRILTLFVTHRTELILKLKEEKFGIFLYEDFQLKEGINDKSTVRQICKKYFPELTSYS